MKMREQMIAYLQNLMDDFQKDLAKYGHDERTLDKMDAMIACKEMAEFLLCEPVNLQQDGKVTVGF